MIQSLFADSVNIERPDGLQNNFDQTLRDVLFLVSKGYAVMWPETFQRSMGSDLSNAMDLARGGQFENIPAF